MSHTIAFLVFLTLLNSYLAMPISKRSTITYESELGDPFANISSTIRNLGTSQPRRNCKQIYDDLKPEDRITGLYMIRPYRSDFVAYCDMTLAGGGWTVIQRRVDDLYSFSDKDWSDYQVGFGKLNGNLWIGLDKIRELTKNGDMELWVGLESYETQSTLPLWEPKDTWSHSHYGKFLLGDEQGDYTLTIMDRKASSTTGDSLSSHNAQKFSTYDRDNDSNSGNCAQAHKGGWWYKDCHSTNLNGVYYPTSYVDPQLDDGISWNLFYHKKSLKTVVMAVRPAET